MKKNNIKNKISKLPETSGVYFFLKNKKILYIGKATSLRSRVRSYFNGRIEETRGPLILKMLSEFTDIKFQKTDSILEALILEANLIKKHKPEANIELKDDKSFNFVVITKEDFPRVLVIRGRELEKNMSRLSEKCLASATGASTRNFLARKYPCISKNAAKDFFPDSKNFSITHKFGPFTNNSQLKEAIKIVRKIFPFRDKCLPFQEKPFAQRSLGEVGCFNHQIGLCPGVCTGEISKKDYIKIIKNIVLFFEGKKKVLIKNLEMQMKTFAKAREFEKADKIKRQIFSLNHIQDIALIKESRVSKATFDTNFRIESYDIAHLSGTNMVGAMTVLENGETKKSDYRKFHIRGQLGADDTKALSEILTRRLKHTEWPMSNLILVDGGIAQKQVAEKILKEHNLNIPVVSVVKNERHKPREILGLNHELRIMNYGKEEKNIKRYEELEKEILLANAEAHRFAISFHRNLRQKLP